MSEPSLKLESIIAATVERSVTGRLARYQLLFRTMRFPEPAFQWSAQFRDEATARATIAKLLWGDRADAVLFDMRLGKVLPL